MGKNVCRNYTISVRQTVNPDVSCEEVTGKGNDSSLTLFLPNPLTSDDIFSRTPGLAQIHSGWLRSLSPFLQKLTHESTEEFE
jgi:hypothetical protein